MIVDDCSLVWSRHCARFKLDFVAFCELISRLLSVFVWNNKLWWCRLLFDHHLDLRADDILAFVGQSFPLFCFFHVAIYCTICSVRVGICFSWLLFGILMLSLSFLAHSCCYFIFAVIHKIALYSHSLFLRTHCIQPSVTDQITHTWWDYFTDCLLLFMSSLHINCSAV